MKGGFMIIKVIIAITVQTTLSDKVHEHRIHEYQSNNSNHSSDKLSADKHEKRIHDNQSNNSKHSSDIFC